MLTLFSWLEREIVSKSMYFQPMHVFCCYWLQNVYYALDKFLREIMLKSLVRPTPFIATCHLESAQTLHLVLRRGLLFCRIFRFLPVPSHIIPLVRTFHCFAAGLIPSFLPSFCGLCWNSSISDYWLLHYKYWWN